MPKPDDDRPQPEPLPVRPPTLPPDFADIPQNPSSELQPPPDPSATADNVAGTTAASDEPKTQGEPDRGAISALGLKRPADLRQTRATRPV